MSEPQDEYAVLVEQARAGDQAALDRLTRQYEKELRLFARVQLGLALRPYLDTLDLVQSVHRSLMMGLRQNKFDVSRPQDLLALALTMVRRKVARHWRRMQRQKRLEAEPSGEPSAPRLLAELSCPQADPAAAAQFQDAVRHLWEHLDPTERRVMELRLEGCTTPEIADELGLDKNTLRVRLFRLRQRLQEAGVLTEWL
jgi:RNA polymerase sigma-70 factor (ECF subfamily)